MSRGGMFAGRGDSQSPAPPAIPARSRVRLATFCIALACVVGAATGARSDDPAPALVADLVADLSDQDPHVRETARKALVRIGAPCTGALAAIACGPDDSRAAEALSVLAEIGPPAAPSLAGVVEFARSAKAGRLCVIARAAARIDPASAQPLVAPLTDAAAAPDEAAARAALSALAALGDVAASAAEPLAKRLPSAPSVLRRPIAETMRAVGADPADAMLRLWFASPPDEHAWVPVLLAESGDAGARAVVPWLRSSDRDVRVRAADLLGGLGSASRAVAPDLVAALGDEAAAVRRAAAKSLGTLGPDGLSMLPALAAGVNDTEGRWQREAITASERICVAIAQKAGGASADAAKIESSVKAGLDWLARHQSPDGRWDADGFSGHLSGGACAGAGRDEYDVGVTGLAVLAFIGAGETQTAGTWSDSVRRALEFLRASQGQDGCIGARSTQHWIYNHDLAALALVEAYRATRASPLQGPAQKAFEFTLAAQNEGLGWRYGVRDGDNDMSSTAWGALVVDAAETAKLGSARKSLAGALALTEKLTDPETGRTGYQVRGGAPARTNEALGRFPPAESEALTAGALVIRLAAGRTARTDPMLAKGAALVASKPPSGTPGSPGWDIYSWSHGTAALRQVGGAAWDTWRRATAETFTTTQERGGCERGSWRADDPWAPDGGRVYATALGVRCLALCAPPPEKRPAMPTEVRAVVAALTTASQSEDAQVKADATGALGRIRGLYR